MMVLFDLMSPLFLVDTAPWATGLVGVAGLLGLLMLLVKMTRRRIAGRLAVAAMLAADVAFLLALLWYDILFRILVVKEPVTAGFVARALLSQMSTAVICLLSPTWILWCLPAALAIRDGRPTLSAGTQGASWGAALISTVLAVEIAIDAFTIMTRGTMAPDHYQSYLGFVLLGPLRVAGMVCGVAMALVARLVWRYLHRKARHQPG